MQKKSLAKKDDKILKKVLQERRQEASKIYVLGLKNFIDLKLRFVKMKPEQVDKLKSLLMAHHTNRWQKIMKIKKIAIRIHETELMIARYQTSCFTEEKKKN